MGGMARFGLSQWLHNWLTRTFPWGTLSVNTIGSFLMGIGFILLVERSLFSFTLTYQLRLLLLTGFLGSFTTFSTFAIETTQLLDNGQTLAGLMYILASTVLCILAAFSGIALTKAFY